MGLEEDEAVEEILDIVYGETKMNNINEDEVLREKLITDTAQWLEEMRQNTPFCES